MKMPKLWFEARRVRDILFLCMLGFCAVMSLDFLNEKNTVMVGVGVFGLCFCLLWTGSYLRTFYFNKRAEGEK